MCRSIRFSSWGAACAVALAVSAGSGAQAVREWSFAEPGISPDGREIAFVSGGDIWTVPASGGDARLLISDPATESRPLFSPDGRSIAFVSTRTGGGDIYVLALESGGLRRVTVDDGLEQLDAWSRDGQWLYFSSSAHDIASMSDVYRVRVSGGTPLPVTADRYANEFGAAPSPDGRRVVFTARGNGHAQWWRKAGSHLDQSEIWMGSLGSTGSLGALTEVTKRDSRSVWPMWSDEGRSILYVSDRGGAENVWTRPASAEGRDRRVTRFTDGRVLWPSITADGRTVAFERAFGIWTLDVASGRAREVRITRRGAPSVPVPERVRQTGSFSDLAVSPDGKKVAFIARGDVFAAALADGGDAMRLTTSAAFESQPVWSADSRRLAYVSARDHAAHIYLYDVATRAETPLTTGTGTDLSPQFSPDGSQLLYLRNRTDLRVLDLASRTDRSVATGTFGDAIDRSQPMWSPDGRWIALFAVGEKQFTNVSLVPVAADAEPRVTQPVSFLANVFSDSIAWGRDGSFLLFATSQRTERGQLARVDLTLRTPRFREDLFRDLFAPPARPAPGTPEPGAPASGASTSRTSLPVRITPVFPDIRRRLSLVPAGLDVQAVTTSPDGTWALLTAVAAGQTQLYLWPLDELSRESGVARQLTSTASAKHDAQFTPDGREVVYLDGGRLAAVSVDRREPRPLTVTAEFVLDFEREKDALFNEAWTLLRDHFYDPGFHGVNWVAQRDAYAPRIAGAANADEMRRIMRLMIGDLNASHLGLNPPAGAPPVVGRLGVTLDPGALAAGRFTVAAVTPLGPAAVAGLAAGEMVTAIDGRPLDAGTDLDERLAQTIDRRVTLTVQPAAGGAAREIAVKPVSQATDKALLYRAWVEDNRAYVLKKSGGRLGYVHMFDMGQGALDQLFIDLDAENHARDGVVVDIRNNNGGFVNAYALDTFARLPYLRMSLRGLPAAPARVVLGQRALEKPTVLVVNQHSLSDAEDFTEGYKTLKLGQVIGEPTAGWIIYTWNVPLTDGSILRLPRMRITAIDGSDMERHPRTVDIDVTRPIGEPATGVDSQLDAAIRSLLARLGRAE